MTPQFLTWQAILVVTQSDRSIFRWAGSKRRLLPTLMEMIPSDFGRYVEPFAGSACLFFATRPSAALLGDVNADLIESYDILRSHPRKLARSVQRFPTDRREYYRIRALDPSTLTPFERATRFVYLNRLCFNGVYRTNRKGIFNVPYGSHQGAAPSEREFFRCSYALRSADLFTGDFEDCLNDITADDFVYLDPPYSSTSRPRHGEYGYDSFQPLDIKRLKSAMNGIDRAGSRFILSYSDNSAHRKAFSKWDTRVIQVRRHVAGFSKHRNIVTELLVSNFDIETHPGGEA